MQDFRNLLVWEKAHLLTLKIYGISGTFPEKERFGLISQMQRSAASIPTNIAEGCGRQTDAEFAKFLYYSTGSASELEYQLLLARDLKYLPKEAWQDLNLQTNEVKRMLIALLKKIKS